MPRTKTDAALAEAVAAHAADPERVLVLQRARAFKASWIELGEALTKVRREGRWRPWGYESFEAYAKTELHLRQETVDKLTGSYAFLKRNAPSVLSRDALREPVPSYQAVDFLRRAHEREDAPREVVDEVRRRVLDEGAPLASVSRAYRDAVFPTSDDERRAKETAGLRNVARRLRELLAETRAVNGSLSRDVRAALDRLLHALGEHENEAA